MSDNREEFVKVILLGESGVGKTNLINIFTGGEFNENEAVSLTSSFLLKKITVNGKKYTIQLWDTIGQERLRQLTKLFYNDSKIVIFVYDITRKFTFDEIKNYWINDVEEKLGQDLIKGIIGNKIDLYLNQQVSDEEAEEYAKSIGAQFSLTSAKNEGAVIFERLLIKLYEQYLHKNKTIRGAKTFQKTKSVYLKKQKDAVDTNTSKKKCC